MEGRAGAEPGEVKPVAVEVDESGDPPAAERNRTRAKLGEAGERSDTSTAQADADEGLAIGSETK